ncbi:hypothetical protein ACFQZC_25545 [Streptacidiphilus monticola]
MLACVIGAYSAITHSRYRVQAMAGALLAATAAATSLRKADPLPGWTGPFVVVLLAGFLASVARTLRQQAQERQQRLEQVLAEQEGRPGGRSRRSGPASPPNCTTWSPTTSA